MASRVVLLCLFLVLINAVYSAPSEEGRPFECPAGEYYEKCKLAVCYRTCADARRPPPCAAIAPGCYEPVCLCADGKLRDDYGKCVTYDECITRNY